MWIIASVPLWLLGVIALLAAFVGGWRQIGHADTDKIVIGFFQLMLMSAGFFYVAARVAS